MSEENVSRRDFIGKTVTGLATVAVTDGVAKASLTSAAYYKKKAGANGRINIGFLSCGDRRSDHQSIVKTAQKDKNLAVVAVCDIWKHNKEKAADCFPF